MTLNCSPWTSQFFITAVAIAVVEFSGFSFLGELRALKISLKFRFLFDDIVMITRRTSDTPLGVAQTHQKKFYYFSCLDRYWTSTSESSKLVTFWKESLVRCDKKLKLFYFHLSLLPRFPTICCLWHSFRAINIFNEKQDRHRAAKFTKFTEFLCCVARRQPTTTGH